MCASRFHHICLPGQDESSMLHPLEGCHSSQSPRVVGSLKRRIDWLFFLWLTKNHGHRIPQTWRMVQNWGLKQMAKKEVLPWSSTTSRCYMLRGYFQVILSGSAVLRYGGIGRVLTIHFQYKPTETIQRRMLTATYFSMHMTYNTQTLPRRLNLDEKSIWNPGTHIFRQPWMPLAR